MTWRVAVLSILAAVVALAAGCGSDSTKPGTPLRGEPDTLRFGPLLVGAADTLALAIFNDGEDAVSLQVRSESPDFAPAQGDTLAIEISPRDSVSVGVVFAPLTPGKKQGTLRIEGDRQAVVGCTGTGESDECSVTPQTLDFGPVPTGSTREKSVVLRNLGTVAFSGRVSEECSDFQVTDGAGPYTLDPGDSLQVTVAFSPQSEGRSACSVNLGMPSCDAVECTGTGSRVWYVKADGMGDAPTVQAAIDSSADGQMVLVGPGTYYENINLRGKAIHLKSEIGPEHTTLDGSQLDAPVILVDSGWANLTIIEGLEITGGKGWVPAGFNHSVGGGGIMVFNSAPTIRGNWIVANTAEGRVNDGSGRGGGINVGATVDDLPPALIQSNIIEGNYSAGNGGGINIAGTCEIVDNVIRGNHTGDGDGAGIYLLAPHYAVTIRGNAILDNSAGDHGGGIYVGNSEGHPAEEIEIAQNILIGNISRTTVAMDCSGGALWIFGGANIHHNTIAFNAATNVSVLPAAGGCCISSALPEMRMAYNLFYKNDGGGVVADERSAGTIVENLVYGHGDLDLYLADGSDIDVTGNLYIDPLFCDTTVTSMGELAEESPALNQPFGVIGAVSEPSCSRPQAAGAWDRMRGLYR